MSVQSQTAQSRQNTAPEAQAEDGVLATGRACRATDAQARCGHPGCSCGRSPGGDHVTEDRAVRVCECEVQCDDVHVCTVHGGVLCARVCVCNVCMSLCGVWSRVCTVCGGVCMSLCVVCGAMCALCALCVMCTVCA